MMQKRSELGKLASALEGIPVWGCLPGSVAQAAGIQYGDVVLAVNGKRTRDIDEYLAARELREDGAEIVVFRNGSERTIELTFRRADGAPDRLASGLIQQVIQERLVPLDGETSEPGSKLSN